MKLLVNTELKDTNLISAINSKLIQVAKYQLTISSLVVENWISWSNYKRWIESEKYAGKTGKWQKTISEQPKRLLGTEVVEDVYKETRLCVACYMHKSTNQWIQAAQRWELLKEENAIVNKWSKWD